MERNLWASADDLVLFARIVESGSFSQAAIRCGLPKSTVSRRLSALESRLGERLLQRNTRQLVLTEFGEQLLEHARQIDVEVAAVAAFSEYRQLEPSGRLRVSAPADYVNLVLHERLPAFLGRYPQIQLELDLSPRRVDLVAESYDLALRMGSLGELANEATLSARRINVLQIGLYASPAYVARRGLPTTPQELTQHEGLCLPTRGGEAVAWRLQQREQHWEGRPQIRALVNSPELLVKLACQDQGIVAVAECFAAAHVAHGALVRLLPAWSLPAVTAWAVFPGRRLLPSRTRVFLEMLEEIV